MLLQRDKKKAINAKVHNFKILDVSSQEEEVEDAFLAFCLMQISQNCVDPNII